MTTDQAIHHFGSEAALAKALGIKSPSVYGWGDRPPALRQLQLAQITRGVLAPDDDVYDMPSQRGKAA